MGMSTDFEGAAFALWQSWETHRQAFGPILEPAFEENQEARILLIDALNHISRREVKQGMELLKKLAPFCAYDEDRAAWAFLQGFVLKWPVHGSKCCNGTREPEKLATGFICLI